MGLFCLPMGTTKIEHIKSLRCNLDIWLDYAERGDDMDYLLSFMRSCLEKAEECANEKN